MRRERRSQRTREGVARTRRRLHGEKVINGFFEAPLEQMLETPEGNHALAVGSGLRPEDLLRQMKAMNRVQEKQRADALIQVVALPAEGIQFRASRQ